MGLDCGAQCAKYILFVFNVFFWLSGILFIAIGAYIALSSELQLLGGALTPGDNHLKIGAIAIIVIGVIIFVVGFCGCCGAIKENQCLLGTYITLLLIILIASVAIGIYCAVKRKDLIKGMQDGFKVMIQKNYPPKKEKTKGQNFKKMIDDLQINGKCCGVESRSEWPTSDWAKGQTPREEFPVSCCGSRNDSVYTECKTKNSFYKKKCADYILDTIKSQAPILIGIACGVGALEIFGIIFACCLCQSIRREYDA